MSLSDTLLRLGASAMNGSGLARILGAKHRGLGAIIVLHSVVRDRREVLYDNLYTGAAFLEAALDHLVASGVDIVGLDEALARLAAPSPRPFMAFTFDDGYLDNLQIALPIFAKRNLPLTTYVTTCFLDRSHAIWWAALRELIKAKDSVSVEGVGAFETGSLGQKVAAYNALCGHVSGDKAAEAAVLDACRKAGITTEALLAQDAMTEAQLREYASAPQVTIGGHTTSHPALSRLSEAEVAREMTENKNHLEALLDRPVAHFAYPYGDRGSNGAREARIAQRVGFRSAVTTRLGCLFPAHLDHPTLLPRVRMFSKYESLALLDCQRKGLMSRVVNRKGPIPVTE